ncbi:hypothetical protein BGZ68_000028 [Mortierella alpina]|nr:hypothetical protein BGZ68_000028 [Mortierella alpina]
MSGTDDATDEDDHVARPRRCILQKLGTFSRKQIMTFLQMDRDTFEVLVDLIFDDEVFTSDNEQQEEPTAQLVVALDRFGSYGNGVGAMRLGMTWDRSRTSCLTYVERVVTALLGLQDQYLAWPTPTQRRVHAARMAEKKFPGCVGFITETTINLALDPAANRKSRSHSVQIVCDMDGRILKIFLSSPGEHL